MTGAVLGDLVRAVDSVPPEAAQEAVGYPSLFLLVMLGSLIPVVPTGALVSSAAVVALHGAAPWSMLLVFTVASAAAFAGDATLYWLGSRGAGSSNGSRWLERLRGRVSAERLETARRKLDEHGVAVLVVSRLVPAGRIPVMLACLLGGTSVRRFLRGDLPACLAWAAAYQLIGVLGGSLFPEPWQGVMAAVSLALLVSTAPGLWQRLRDGCRRRRAASG